MLVLTRKKNEKIKIKVAGKEIVITITGILNGKVKVGLDADKDVKIVRTEIEGKPEKIKAVL